MKVNRTGEFSSGFARVSRFDSGFSIGISAGLWTERVEAANAVIPKKYERFLVVVVYKGAFEHI